MFNIVLYQPEIPPNTGNIIRLCANTGTRLHLIQPLGFELQDRALRRAGLDYHEYAEVRVHESLEVCLTSINSAEVFAFSTHARRRLNDVKFSAGCALLFGAETRGLPEAVREKIDDEGRLVRLPMVATSRSLNLSNAVAVALYEAWRQHDYVGSHP